MLITHLSDFGLDLKPTKAISNLIIGFPGFQLLFFLSFITNFLVFFLSYKKEFNFLADAAVTFSCVFLLTPPMPVAVRMLLSEPHPWRTQHWLSPARSPASPALPGATCRCRRAREPQSPAATGGEQVGEPHHPTQRCRSCHCTRVPLRDRDSPAQGDARPPAGHRREPQPAQSPTGRRFSAPSRCFTEFKPLPIFSPGTGACCRPVAPWPWACCWVPRGSRACPTPAALSGSEE